MMKQVGRRIVGMDKVRRFLEGFFGYEVVPTRGDIYESKAERQKWRSRDAFKLLHIDEKFDIFNGVTRAVDLMASPGVWTQVLSRILHMGEPNNVREKCCLFYKELAVQQKMEEEKAPTYDANKDVKIVAVDVNMIPSYPGVVQICKNLMNKDVLELILEKFDGKKAQLVVCGKNVEFSDIQSIDVIFQTGILTIVTTIACNILEVGGTMVTAILKELDCEMVKAQLLPIFKNVDIYKPKSSKISAKETFIICRQYCPPEGFNPKLMLPFLDCDNRDFSKLSGINRILIPFIMQGDTIAYPLSKKLFKTQCVDTLHSEREFKLEDQQEIHKKEIKAAKSVAMKTDPDLRETKEGEERNQGGAAGPSHEVKIACNESPGFEPLPNGPFSELIEKTTKIKEYPSEDSQIDSDEERLQFLYDSDPSETEALNECLDQVKTKISSSTCTCYSD